MSKRHKKSRRVEREYEKTEEVERISDGSIWKNPAVIFGLLLFPAVPLLCAMLYLIQVYLLGNIK